MTVSLTPHFSSNPKFKIFSRSNQDKYKTNLKNTIAENNNLSNPPSPQDQESRISLKKQLISSLKKSERELYTIFENVKNTTHVDEWIQLGLFETICNLLCKPKVTTETIELSIQVFKCTLTKSNFLKFCSSIYSCLENCKETASLLFVLYELVNTNKEYLDAFNEYYGVNMLLDYYVAKLFDGKLKYTFARKSPVVKPITNELRKSAEFVKDDRPLSPQIKFQAFRTPKAIQNSHLQDQAKRSSVPRLLIPNVHNEIEGITRATRRSNRSKPNSIPVSISFDSLRIPKQKEVIDTNTSLHKLSSLAAKLGEIYVAPDLTILITFKRSLDAQLITKKDLFSTIKETKADIVEEKKDTLNTLKLITSQPSIWLRKNLVLKIIELATRQSRKTARNPTNLLLYELNSLKKPADSTITKINSESVEMINKIFSHFAEDVESTYLKMWKTKEPKDTTQLILKKMDLFLWRWSGAVENIIRNDDVPALNDQLQALYEYLNACNTRVHASQCATVCLELLLNAQQQSREKIDKFGLSKDKNLANTVHHLLGIFDYMIASPEKHPLLLEFFYHMLIDNEENFKWLKEYTKYLLTTTDEVTEKRIRLMKHYQTLMDLLHSLVKEFSDTHMKKKKKYDTEDSTASFSGLGEYEVQESRVMKKFDFLMNPVDGLLLRFITSTPMEEHFEVKKEMLYFLEKIFRLPHLPFAVNETYVNSYVRFHFLNFVKLYVGPKSDAKTFECCTLHLNVLKALSMNKTPQIISRFKALRVVEFLAREIDLEYEVKNRRKSYLKDELNLNIPLDEFKVAPSQDEPSDTSDEYISESETEIPTTPHSEYRQSDASLDDIPPKQEEIPAGEVKIPALNINKTEQSTKPVTNSPITMPSLKLPLSKLQDKSEEKKPPVVPKLSLGQDKPAIPKLNIGGNTQQQQNITESENQQDDTEDHYTDDEESGSQTPQTPAEKQIPSIELPTKPFAPPKIPKLSLGKPAEETTDEVILEALQQTPDPSPSPRDKSEDQQQKTKNAQSLIPKLNLGGKLEQQPQPTIEESNTDSARSSDVSSIASPVQQPTQTKQPIKIPALALGIKKNEASNVKPASEQTITSTTSIDDDITETSEASDYTPTPKQEQKPKLNIPSLNLPNLNTEGMKKSNTGTTPRLIQSDVQGTIVMNQAVSARSHPTSITGRDTEDDTHSYTETYTDDDSDDGEDSVDSPKVEQKAPPTKPGIKVPSLGLKLQKLPEPTEQEKSEADLMKTYRSLEDTNDQQDDNDDEDKLYEHEKNNRKIYKDEKLHVALISLLVSLMITNKQTLDHNYCDQFPTNKNMINIPFLLHMHINHKGNEHIIPALHDSLMKLGRGACILLRLVCKKLFQAELYKNRDQRIGVGAYGTVWKCRLPFNHSSVKSVAVKLLPVPKSYKERCVLHDIFNEILIMEQFKGAPYICRLYDFGVDDEYYYIVMKLYKCSLRMWREKQTLPLTVALPLYMNIFNKILYGVKFLVDNHVNHFDLKCDNIFLEPFDGVSDNDFWHHKTEVPNFHIVIGDFGESHLYDSENDGYTTRHRGTDCIKSPEMLKIEMMKNTSKYYDRRKKVGASAASDVWSLGCLFFELMAGDFLFNASDFPTFYGILTDETKPLISQERFSKIHYQPLLNDVLSFILIREPERRPSIDDIINKNGFWLSLMPDMETLKKKTKLNFDALHIDLTSKSLKEALKSPKNFELEEINYNIKTERLSRRDSSLRNLKIKDNEEDHVNKIYAKYLWSSADVAFYTSTVTEVIKDRLYLTSDKMAANKTVLTRLGISYIVNCSENPPPFEDNFFYFSLKESNSTPPTTSKAYNEFLNAFSFVRAAIKARGKVLVYSGKGLSRAVLFIVLYLLHTYNLSSYEAFLFVLRKRPASRPEILTHFLNFLSQFKDKFTGLPGHVAKSISAAAARVRERVRMLKKQEQVKPSKRSEKKFEVQWFRCLCGTCLVGVVGQTYCYRACLPGKYEHEHSPLKIWPSFLEEMRLMYIYDATNVLLGMTTRKYSFLNDFELDKHTEEYKPPKVLGPHQVDIPESNIWKVYRCKYCGYMTHAVKKEVEKPVSIENLTEMKDIPLNEVDVALNMNIKTFLHSSNDTKIQDMRPALLMLKCG